MPIGGVISIAAILVLLGGFLVFLLRRGFFNAPFSNVDIEEDSELPDQYSGNGALVLRAFRESDYKPQTIGGIARATGLSKEAVHQILDENQNTFERASFQMANQDIYSLTEEAEIIMRKYLLSFTTDEPTL